MTADTPASPELTLARPLRCWDADLCHLPLLESALQRLHPAEATRVVKGLVHYLEPMDAPERALAAAITGGYAIRRGQRAYEDLSAQSEEPRRRRAPEPLPTEEQPWKQNADRHEREAAEDRAARKPPETPGFEEAVRSVLRHPPGSYERARAELLYHGEWATRIDRAAKLLGLTR